MPRGYSESSRRVIEGGRVAAKNEPKRASDRVAAGRYRGSFDLLTKRGPEAIAEVLDLTFSATDDGAELDGRGANQFGPFRMRGSCRADGSGLVLVRRYDAQIPKRKPAKPRARVPKPKRAKRDPNRFGGKEPRFPVGDPGPEPKPRECLQDGAGWSSPSRRQASSTRPRDQ